MWYNDLLLVMLLVVLALLVFTAILVATKIRKPVKQTELMLDETVETTQEEVISIKSSEVTEGTIYEKLYSEAESEFSVESNSIEESPITTLENNIVPEDNDLEPHPNGTAINYPEQGIDLDEWEQEYDETLVIPAESTVEEPLKEVEVSPPQAEENYDRLDDGNQSDESLNIVEDENDDKLFFDYDEEIDEDSYEEDSEYFFNLKPQSLEDLKVEEENADNPDKYQKSPKLEPPSSIVIPREIPYENQVQEDKPELGVMICPHCNAKVPATLYCIICGRPMKK